MPACSLLFLLHQTWLRSLFCNVQKERVENADFVLAAMNLRCNLANAAGAFFMMGLCLVDEETCMLWKATSLANVPLHLLWVWAFVSLFASHELLLVPRLAKAPMLRCVAQCLWWILNAAKAGEVTRPQKGELSSAAARQLLD